MQLKTPRRWLAAIPMRYVEGIGFWDRDSALLCPEFQKAGVDARFVALGEPAVRKDVPLILSTLEQMEDTNWWKQWNAEGVQLSAWAAPRYEPITRAIKSSGATLVVHCDSNGIKSPRTDFLRYLACRYVQSREEGRRLALLTAPLKSVLFYCFSALHDQGMMRHLSHADVILIESPLAFQRLARLFRSYRREDLIRRLKVLGHPVPDYFHHDPRVAKQHRLVAVGRWDSYAKDAPLLVRTLKGVLACEPDYSASIIGSGQEIVMKLVSQLPESIRSRVQILGRIANRELVPHYQAAQIICVSSRNESFHIAAAEALCCGCSVAGPAALPSMHYFAGASSGSLAIERRAPDLADAILCEIDAWKKRDRDPVRISAHWRGQLLAAKHVETLLQIGAARSIG